RRRHTRLVSDWSSDVCSSDLGHCEHDRAVGNLTPESLETAMSFKRIFHAVETHAGEPMRVITGGVPHIPGNSVYEQMRWLEKNRSEERRVGKEGRSRWSE